MTNEQSIHTTSSRKPYARLQSCTLVCTPPSLIEYIIHRLLMNIYFIECENRREFQIRKITSYPLYVLVCDKSYDSYVYGMALLDLLTTFYDILCYVFPPIVLRIILNRSVSHLLERAWGCPSLLDTSTRPYLQT